MLPSLIIKSEREKMLMKNFAIILVLLCVYFENSFAQESSVKIQIREPQKLIGQLEKYVFGNGLQSKESDVFFSPIQKSLLTTIQGLEPLIGVKSENILDLLNANIDLTYDTNFSRFKFRADYPTKEIATKSVDVIKNLFSSKASIMLTEKKDGEMLCYSDEVNGNFYMSIVNNSLYIQAGNFNDVDKKKISYSPLPLTKSKPGALFNFILTPELMQEAMKDEKILNALYGQGLNYTLSFADHFIEVNSEIKLPKSEFFQAIAPKTPISSQAYKTISQNATFAIAVNFNFSQILQTLTLLKEFPETKEAPQAIEKAKLNFSGFTNLDLQKDFLGHMGNEIIFSSIPEEESGGNPIFSILSLNSFYFAIPLKNSNAFETSLVKLLTKVGQIASVTPIATPGDGIQTITLEGAKAYYLRIAQGLITPCFMIKENNLYITTNIASLEYINKNCNTWGTIAESKDFQNKVPTKNATVFLYEKFAGNPKRTNVTAHLTSTAALGTLIFCNYMGNEMLNPTSSGEPYRQIAAIIKPIVSSIDFARYPASKNFQVPYGDKYYYWTFQNNTLYYTEKSGHILNDINGVFPVVFVTATIATIAVPQLLDARRNSNQRAAIGSLRAYMTDQETYKADNSTYATIAQLKANAQIDLTKEKAGYVFTEIIKKPTEDYFAILASPKTWGSSGKSHYIITSMGTVRACLTKDLPYDFTKETPEKIIELIEELPEAR